MKEIIYKCDGCGKVKGLTNHWYAVVVNEAGAQGSIVIFSFQRAVNEDHENAEHFCGEECLLKMVARNLPK